MITFDALDLSNHLLRAVQTQGYDAPTPIQQRSIPHIITGTDLAAEAQTGSEKTAALRESADIDTFKIWKKRV
jgi:ATP-dependent RNA helicase RhlE